MTFEKALGAMKNQKKVRRAFWQPNVCIGTDVDNIIRNMTYDNKFGIYEHCMPTEFESRDLLADDWEIHEPEKRIDPDAFVNADMKAAKKLSDFWFIKANRHTEEYAKMIRDQIFEAYKLEPEKEESTMYETIEITFKSGGTITYSKDEWDDYSYDGSAISVKKDGAWVGIYNFDHVFSVELKK